MPIPSDSKTHTHEPSERETMVASQMIESNFLYQRSPEEAANVNPRIRSVVMDIRARYGAMRILGIGSHAQLLCHDLHHAGYSVAGLYPEESAATGQSQSLPPQCTGRRLIDPSPIKDAPFDMVISIEFCDPSSMPSVLIKLASMKLQYGGIFILSIPYGGYLKNLLTTMREWLTPPYFIPWDGGYIQRWSKKCLTTLMEAYGFNVIEIIGVRGSSLEWESLILVARKTHGQKSTINQ